MEEFDVGIPKAALGLSMYVLGYGFGESMNDANPPVVKETFSLFHPSKRRSDALLSTLRNSIDWTEPPIYHNLYTILNTFVSCRLDTNLRRATRNAVSNGLLRVPLSRNWWSDNTGSILVYETPVWLLSMGSSKFLRTCLRSSPIRFQCPSSRVEMESVRGPHGQFFPSFSHKLEVFVCTERTPS